MNVSKFALLSAFFLSSTRMDPPPSTSTTTPSSVAHALSQSIVVVGLNPALQKRFVLMPGANLEPGGVHRAHRCDIGVGGKGQDVGVAMSCLTRRTPTEKGGVGSDDDVDGGGADGGVGGVILAQFLGAGAEGDAVRLALSSRHGLTDDSLTVRVASPLRTCTTVVGADVATELVETSGGVTPGEVSALLGAMDGLSGGGRRRADCVCVMGSVPPGCPEGTYAEAVSRLADSGTLVLVDSVVGLGPLLGTLKSIFGDGDRGDGDGDDGSSNAKREGGGAVLKLNAAELCELGGVTRAGGGGGTRGPPRRPRVRGWRSTCARGRLTRPRSPSFRSRATP